MRSLFVRAGWAPTGMPYVKVPPMGSVEVTGPDGRYSPCEDVEPEPESYMYS